MAYFDRADVLDEDYFRQQLFNAEALAALRSASAETNTRGKREIDPILLLLGLMEDASSVAVAIVCALGETPERIQHATRSLMTGTPAPSVPPTSAQAGFPLNEQARQVCRLAIDEAMRVFSNPRYVGSEHLLLGVVRVDSAPLDTILRPATLTLERVRGARNTVLGLPRS
jgi:ATP-dependent Clp protease ATP-binding subunit ClpA